MKKREEFSADEAGQRLKMAKAIKSAREASGLTQQELATRLGRSVANIRAWERVDPPAAVPGGEVAVALSEALGRTLDELYIGVARKRVERTHPSLEEFLRLTPDIAPEHVAELRAVDPKGGDPGVAFYSLLYQAIRAREQHQTLHMPSSPPVVRLTAPASDFAGKWLAGIVEHEAECGALRPAVRERLLAMRHNAGEIQNVRQAIRDAIAEDSRQHPEDHGLPAHVPVKRGADRGRAKPLARKRR